HRSLAEKVLEIATFCKPGACEIWWIAPRRSPVRVRLAPLHEGPAQGPLLCLQRRFGFGPMSWLGVHLVCTSFTRAGFISCGSPVAEPARVEERAGAPCSWRGAGKRPRLRPETCNRSAE